MERAPPARLEVGRTEERRPRLADDVEPGTVLTGREKRERLDRALAPEEREDERLDDGQRPVARPRVAPGLEEVGERRVPRGERRRLVEVRAEVDDLLGLLRGVGEAEVGRRVVGGVAAEHDERLHLARPERGDERAEAVAVRQERVLRLVVRDGRALVPERRVHRGDGRVDRRRLSRPGEHQRGAAVVEEVLHERAQEGGVEAVHGGSRRRRVDVEARRSQVGEEARRERRNEARAEAEAVVGVGTGDRQHGLDRPQTAHLVLRPADAPAGGEAARVADHLRVGVEEVGVDREDRARLLEPVHGEERPPERPGDALVHVSLAGGLVDDETGARELRPERRREAEERRGRGGRQEEGEAVSPFVRARPLRPARDERGPARRLAAPPHGRGAVGVVEVEDRRLHARARRAAARRVQLVALDLRGPPLVALDDESPRAGGAGHRRGVAAGDARNDLLRSLDVGDDVGLGPAARGERSRRAEQRDHVPARDRIGRRRGVLGELPLAERSRLGRLLERVEAAPRLAAQR